MRLRHWLGLALLLSLAACQRVLPTPSQTAPPAETPLSPRRSDQLRVGEGSVALYRLMEAGDIRHVRDWAAFVAFGFQMGDVTTVPLTQLASYPIGMPLTRWVTGVSDTSLYVLIDGRRHLITDPHELAAAAVSPTEVSQLPDDLLDSLPLAGSNLDPVFDEGKPVAVNAASWWQGCLWIADAAGRLRAWQGSEWQQEDHPLPDGSVIQVLIHDDDHLYAGTTNGGIWALDAAKHWRQLVKREDGWIAALVLDETGGLWYADSSHYDWGTHRYQPGRGLIRLDLGTLEESNLLPATSDAAGDPLRSVTALAWDGTSQRLWVGTRFGGLHSYRTDTHEWQHNTLFDGGLAGNAISALRLATDGGLWIATDRGIQRLADGTFANPSEPSSAAAIALVGNEVWAAGTGVVAHSTDGQSWQIDRAFDTPALLDQFASIVLDDAGLPWFAGEQRIVHFDGQEWETYDITTGAASSFAPGISASMVSAAPVLPSPQEDYAGWLQAWPRPQADNGRCLHYLQGPSGDEFEVRLEIARLKQLGVRWTLVNYTDRSQLLMMAPLFREAGIMVVWRPFVRPYQDYDYWAEDIAFLLSQNVAPYIQVYNEPNLDQEWDGQPVDQAVYQSHLLPAIQEVVDAGGLAGLQHIDADWLRADLRQIKAAGMDNVFDRLFFVPHPYGANHPPDYDEDNIGVLSFRQFSSVFEEEIGFVPPMIAGEGGWRLGDASDTRFPAIDETLHRDYHIAVFDWFRMGILSNGESLPDTLFALCPWLLSDSTDPAAWFDSASGDRVLTIQGVAAIPDFVRQFSWNKHER